MSFIPTYCAVWNWRNKKNSNGLYKIHIRISLNGDKKYDEVKIPRKVRQEEWAGKPNAWVKNTHTFAYEINEQIKQKLDVLDKLVKRYYNANQSLNFPTIFRELGKNYNTNSFNAFFESYIKAPRESVTDETLNRYRASLLWLNRFNPGITFNDLSDSLFLDFKKYCQSHAKLEASTINGYFNAVKKVVYWARKDNHITKEHQETVFEDVHISIKKKPSVHLEVHEIIQWRDHKFSEKTKSLKRDRDLFLLLVYTGLYYNDLKELHKTDIKTDPIYGKYIWVDRYKNENLSIIPLWKFPHAMELIETYQSSDPKDPYLIDREHLLTDQVFNRRLKLVAKDLLWKINMINKMGRTTNSQLYIRFGADRPIVSKILGHEKEATTETYYTINIADVIEGTKRVDFQKIGL